MPPKQGDRCPFCQLIENPEQLNIIGETENFYAWLEYPTPRAKGQANIVPKEHRESVMELSPPEWQEAMNLLRKTMEQAIKGLDADGLSVTMNVKEAGGQMLPHAYIQVFPRFEGEENAGTPTGAIFPQREDLQSEIESIKEKMEAVDISFGVETHEAHPDSQKHESGTERGFGSRLVDRNEARKNQEKTGEPEETEKDEEAGEMLEPDEKTEESEDEGKREKESEEPEGEGHWDGKSFEWR